MGRFARALGAAGWRPAPAIQPASTRLIDLRADEAALWSDLRKKWRQYVNRARTGGVTVEDADGDALGIFYAIYRETAARAGFLIRTEAAYRDVWNAYRPAGLARLLIARLPDGEPAAALFLVRCGARVVEPYGGMTQAGRGVARQLPPEVGGDPLVAGRRRRDVRPVGPGAPRDRALQDRVRRARGPLHRVVGPRPRSARALRLRGGAARPGVGRPPAARARRRGRGAPGTGGDVGRRAGDDSGPDA